MSKGLTKGLTVYIVLDYLSAIIAWTLFVIYRKAFLERDPFTWEYLRGDQNFLYGILLLPLLWLMLYALVDSYKSIYRMSRMTELVRTLFSALIGTIIIFFALLLNDIDYYTDGYKGYYMAFLALFFFHSATTLFFRLLILSWASSRIKRGKQQFRTLLIGSGQPANDIYHEICNQKKRAGNYFLGFMTVNEHPHSQIGELEHLGSIQQLEEVLSTLEIEEVILALESNDHKTAQHLLNRLSARDVLIKVIPDMYDILLGKVKMNHLYGAVLIEISPKFMPTWFAILKRSIDVFASAVVLLLLAPLYLFIAFRVWLSSKGPIFYTQERVGLHGKPFQIIKFRSMFVGAESGTPKLSSDTDDRCTPWGRIMRKYRLDELPQFWNVLRGDMSLVGPRPERQFFIDQIAERAPHVRHLLRVRPGITSWGQVKYGYASNVDEMVQRLRYDILYIENISLVLDIKILFYTVLVIIQGRGK